MSVLMQRRVSTGLLILAMILPGWSGHICRCGRAAGNGSFEAAPAKPLRSCCAKRREAKSKPIRGVSSVRSRCCCDEIHWSRAVARIAPVREVETAFLGPAAAWQSTLVGFVDCPVAASLPDAGEGRAGPEEQLCISLCRWQA